MNKYLIKIAEVASKKTLPYRDRVEVLITKGDLVLVMKCKNKDTGDEWWAFPGGGLDGDSPKKACENECLEEVGIRIKNPKYLGIDHTQEGGMSKKEDRHLKYRGSKTKWYVAEYEGMDKSKHGNDGDSRKYSFKTHQEALEAIKQGKVMSVPRCRALKALKPV
jgi:8-oxo-dGTP pyrophosphatase MutT (NUDIX family)